MYEDESTDYHTMGYVYFIGGYIIIVTSSIYAAILWMNTRTDIRDCRMQSPVTDRKLKTSILCVSNGPRIHVKDVRLVV